MAVFAQVAGIVDAQATGIEAIAAVAAIRGDMQIAAIC
jgi:hypothetical protein